VCGGAGAPAAPLRVVGGSAGASPSQQAGASGVVPQTTINPAKRQRHKQGGPHMGFMVNTFDGVAGDRSGPVYELADDAGTVRAEVWPMWAFNCLCWQVRQSDGNRGTILFPAPDWETNPVPTRSGHPILFPFPGRMREGKFTFEGKTYQLPLNDSTKQHAIHGFTPRNPWRVTDWNGDDEFAF